MGIERTRRSGSEADHASPEMEGEGGSCKLVFRYTPTSQKKKKKCTCLESFLPAGKIKNKNIEGGEFFFFFGSLKDDIVYSIYRCLCNYLINTVLTFKGEQKHWSVGGGGGSLECV